MLLKYTKLNNSRVIALDGELGRIRDVYFDDSQWIVRYIVVDTGGWLSNRKVLIAPRAVQLFDAELHLISVNLTCEQIQASPDIDADQSVSRQHESEFHRYYGYPVYWGGSMNGVVAPMPPSAIVLPPDPTLPSLSHRTEALQPRHTFDSDDPANHDYHLRSAGEVTGYRIRVTDDDVGHVEDFLFDDETWALRYLIAKTGVWFLGKHLLVTYGNIRNVDWGSRCVGVQQTRAEVSSGREFGADHPPPGDLGSALRQETRLSPGE
jgi:uncharacterized protein YrrD